MGKGRARLGQGKAPKKERKGPTLRGAGSPYMQSAEGLLDCRSRERMGILRISNPIRCWTVAPESDYVLQPLDGGCSDSSGEVLQPWDGGYSDSDD